MTVEEQQKRESMSISWRLRTEMKKSHIFKYRIETRGLMLNFGHVEVLAKESLKDPMKIIKTVHI